MDSDSGRRLDRFNAYMARLLTLVVLTPIILASFFDHPRQTVRETYYIIVGRFEDIDWQRDPPHYEQDWIDELWVRSRGDRDG